MLNTAARLLGFLLTLRLIGLAILILILLPILFVYDQIPPTLLRVAGVSPKILVNSDALSLMEPLLALSILTAAALLRVHTVISTAHLIVL